MEVDSLTYDEFVNIMKRRKWTFVLSCGFTVALAITIALLLPSRYMSSAKILIEEQEIPQNFVRTTVTSFAEQRVQTIKQRILSSAKLADIINQLKLYPDLRKELPIEQIVLKMRDDIQIENINVNVVNQRTGRETMATIAFALSFQSRKQEVAQQVTSLLTSMFLEENLKLRKRQTTETTEFLENEISRIEKDIASIDGQITSFKEKHVDTLPAMFQLNVQTLHDIELKKEKLSEELLAKKERMEYLQAQLANMPAANREMTDQRKLDELEAYYANLKSQYTDEYPDVVKTRDEITDLKHKIATNPEIDNEKKGYLDNPAHVALNTQLSGIVADMNSLKRQIVEYAKKEDEYRKRIETSLRLEDEYRTMVTKRDNTQVKHNDLIRKLMEAKVSAGLEDEQKGERFTLLEPANYPEVPFKPNRTMIIVLGFIAGIGLASGAAAFREYFDHSVYDGDMLARATSFPVLGCIPEIITSDDIARKRRRKIVIFALVLLIIVGACATFNYFFPYTVAQLMEKIR